ncbi:MAG: hypothetical protein DRP03_00195 [Candidatus Aenigmatarchaeota archaeon]|nr:MAG: hypothetical protein DRP03_00195 [Candidatus Aenigmarchaeota archaeon]
MEKEFTSLDIFFILKEIRDAINGGFIRKIHQYNGKGYSFLLDIYSPRKGESFWLYFDKNKIYITEYKKKAPYKLPIFCSILRKYLENAKIESINQHEFERIVELCTTKGILVIELFSKGNVILCNQDREIIAPLYTQHWKDREIKRGAVYSYPPPKPNPFSMSFEDFKKIMSNEKKVIVGIALMGFGGTYGKEICKIANIDENRIAKELSMNEVRRIFKAISTIKKREIKATVYEDDVTPFPLEIYKNKKIIKTFDSFSPAIDNFIISKIKSSQQIEGEEKIKRIIERQKSAIEKWEKKEKESREKANIIYTHYPLFKTILQWIRNARDKGMGWEEIKKWIKEKGTGWADNIKEIREHEGVIIVNVENNEIEIDIKKSTEENAAMYFENAKKARRKIKGIMEAIKKYEDMEKCERKERERESIKKKEKKAWYEKFRYFYTSDNFLVLGGKDAVSNEVLIKKYTDKNDVVLHADITGSPFVVIKSAGKKITEVAKKEASEFAAIYSKAWQRGLMNVDVYCVRPEQISKKAPSGEYLGKGSFMIYGKREWFRNVELKLAIGFVFDKACVRVIGGPLSTIKNKTEYFVVIRPGDLKLKEIVEKIKKKVARDVGKEKALLIKKINISDFQRFIPAGKGSID